MVLGQFGGSQDIGGPEEATPKLSRKFGLGGDSTGLNAEEGGGFLGLAAKLSDGDDTEGFAGLSLGGT